VICDGEDTPFRELRIHPRVTSRQAETIEGGGKPPHFFYEKCGIRQGFFFPVFHLSICVSSAVEGGRLCWNVFPAGNRLTNFYPFRLEAIT
jgi:hypothetical protein